MDSNKLKNGQVILLEQQPFKVIEATRRQQPRMAAKMITKLKNIITGSMIEKTFSSAEEVQEADISRISAQYIYSYDDNYVFMDTNTSEQFELNKEKLGNAIKFLKEGIDVQIITFNGNPIDIELPLSMVLTIEHTEPAVKGDSVTNIMKNATLETGHIIQVPLFINSGEKIIVNTETGEYKGRSKD